MENDNQRKQYERCLDEVSAAVLTTSMSCVSLLSGEPCIFTICIYSLHKFYNAVFISIWPPCSSEYKQVVVLTAYLTIVRIKQTKYNMLFNEL